MRLLLISILLACISGCDKHHSRSSSSPAPVSAPAVLLISSDAGTDKQGAVFSIDIDDISQISVLFQSQGRHKPYDESRFYNGGFIWNPVDKKFWGVVPSHFPAAGKLVSFDPETDALAYEAVIPELFVSGSSNHPYQWYTRPILKPDGKGLLLVSLNGGRESVPYGPGYGDGVVVYINIDKSEPATFGHAHIVFEFYEGYTSATSDPDLAATSYLTADDGVFRNVKGNPVLGKYPGESGADAVLFLAEGESWTDTRVFPVENYNVHAKAFILQPGDAGDWSQPWNLVFHDNPVGYASTAVNLTGTEAFYDPNTVRADNNPFTGAKGRFVYSVTSATVSETNIRSDDTAFSEVINSANFECYYNAGMFMLNNDYYQFCKGYNRGSIGTYYETRNIPRIMEVDDTGGANHLTTDAIFAGWKNLGPDRAQNIAPLDFTIDRLRQSILVTAGTLDGIETIKNGEFYKNMFFYPSRIEEVKPAISGSSRTVLFEGKAEYGEQFSGSPAIGGDNFQYILQLALTADPKQPGYLIKYDRDVRAVTSAIALGSQQPAYFGSKPILLENSIFFSSMDLPNGLGAGYVKLAKDGSMYEAIEHGRMYDTSRGLYDYPGTPLNYVALNSGEIWAMSKGTYSGNYLTFLNIDPSTGEPTSRSFLGEFVANAGSNNPIWKDGIHTRFTLSAKDNILVFPEWTAGPGISVPVNLSCLPVNTPTVNISNKQYYQLSDGEKVVRGLTLHTDGYFYVATHVSHEILKVDIGDCTSSPIVSTVHDLAADNAVPTTQFLLASDDKLWFGTEDGYLAVYDPIADTVVKFSDLNDQDANTDSRVIGFLSEPENGLIMGIVSDTLSSNRNSVARRLFQYDIVGNVIQQIHDVSDIVLDKDLYPGVIRR